MLFLCRPLQPGGGDVERTRIVRSAGGMQAGHDQGVCAGRYSLGNPWPNQGTREQ